MTNITKLTGLVAAVHTPFDDRGEVYFAVVEKQAAHLAKSGVQTVFICGSTGESHSLTLDERLRLNERWSEVTRGSSLKVVVHVGSNCLADAKTLAAAAARSGAIAVSALTPSYFKPKSIDVLVDCCREIASAAPELPFYFYDIPSMTGVHLSMPDFLQAASERIPNLAGLKFTNSDLMSYQRCLQAQGGRFDVPWGVDEFLLAALSLGARGAVGSSYNFAAPIYLRVMDAFTRGELNDARAWQFRSVQLIEVLARYGYMGAAKFVMRQLGVDVGAPRLPNASLSMNEQSKLQSELEGLGFFDWL
ncbi:MAG: dihydrodipicolinate synthase family protein [Pirellulales bacterium]